MIEESLQDDGAVGLPVAVEVEVDPPVVEAVFARFPAERCIANKLQPDDVDRNAVAAGKIGNLVVANFVFAIEAEHIRAGTTGVGIASTAADQRVITIAAEQLVVALTPGQAVVAGEVRTLAQRSAQAAKEIKALIDDSGNRVNAGTALVHEAGETMAEIVSAVTQVTDIMGEIASASDEQSRGIDQVGQAVAEMDRVTQQNASLVEESASAAAALAEQAARLNQTVAVFKVSRRMAA